ncbi:Acetyl-CoA:oxalate CoA-transferase [Paraburkholderia aspalathi]|uniref:Acetyl-CoA:oxalate CoA-transferase n=1 Tax=Paraburkholderia aspalathi TaxID=1324617 RepID=A0ABM8SZG9_9BURK|nr:CoA transferase [Paraburkholderia aspalathi]MBK3823242.1 CoA transferase [Paraburkholderia aspalathi]MBK3835080.1 CoA transferase [Paraburkholderia aspalathi]MBK3864828.1 CoA transferase [Paraburkholderia aspalathi]CAE6844952.1 Acetyl-CoA:oxalate CoA-transferase [Paraburkholderia aspalathi]
MDASRFQPGALDGVRVVDLSRILAGPSCTQLLADLGADVVKVEKPGEGDDTRKWGPPYHVGHDGTDIAESAYYCAANRNKRSVEIDLASTSGQLLVRELLGDADVVVENYKVGALSRYGLGYDHLSKEFPRLVYCSITGFGQTGPYADRPGYDFVAQAMGGLMSITGQPEGEPTKVGVGIVDLMCGMYATVGILAALRHRDRTGEGQHIDCSLLDSCVAMLANEGTNFLTSGKVPQRRGNDHPNIVPYRVFQTADGFMIVAVGNDQQFQKWCVVAGAHDLASHPDYQRNADRVRNREVLNSRVAHYMRSKHSAAWLEELGAAGVPCSPIHDIQDAFHDPHVRSRGMLVEIDSKRTKSGAISVIGNPLKMSRTPPTYRMEPPSLGEHTGEVFREWLDKREHTA